jgi:hypothetical protein
MTYWKARPLFVLAMLLHQARLAPGTNPSSLDPPACLLVTMPRVLDWERVDRHHQR